MPRGVPQIEISYDLDENGILTVTACEKSTGKSDNIQVTNDKGRLSKDDIEKMVADAEKFKEDDIKAKEIIDAKNNFENNVYQMKTSLSDEKISSLIDEELKTNLTKIIEENVSWLENNQNVSKEEYESRLKNFQESMKPLQEKMMASMQGMGEMPKSHPSDETTHGSPKVLDIDDVD